MFNKEMTDVAWFLLGLAVGVGVSVIAACIEAWYDYHRARR